MGWRGPAAVVALLLLGLAGGYGVAGALQDEPAGAGTAQPVVASSPSVPVDPEPTFEPDPEDPPLPPDLPLTEATMGTGRSAFTYPVPVGWRSTATAANEAKWKQPGTSNNTYVMRVEQVVSQDRPIDDAVEQRVAQLEAEQEGVQVLARGPRLLEYTYRSDEGTFRHSFVRFLDLSGRGLAAAEVVVHGRERDVPGTRDLVARVAAGVSAEGPGAGRR